MRVLYFDSNVCFLCTLFFYFQKKKKKKKNLFNKKRRRRWVDKKNSFFSIENIILFIFVCKIGKTHGNHLIFFIGLY